MDSEIVPEFIQKDCNANKITPVLNQMLISEPVIAKQKQNFEKIIDKLKPHSRQNSSDIAADAILELVPNDLLNEHKAAK